MKIDVPKNIIADVKKFRRARYAVRKAAAAVYGVCGVNKVDAVENLMIAMTASSDIERGLINWFLTQVDGKPAYNKE